MEGCILNQQRTIRISSDVLQTMQLTRNISKDDEQHFLGITSQMDIGKLHGRLCNTSKDNEGTGRTNNQIPKNSRETQLVFQTIKMRFQYGRNPYLRGSSWKRTSQDGTKKDKSSKRVEDTNKNQGR